MMRQSRGEDDQGSLGIREWLHRQWDRLLGRASLGSGHTPGANEGDAVAPVVVLAAESERVIGREVRDGCDAIEDGLAALRATILSLNATYSGTIREEEALERVWINLLRLGLIDELHFLAEERGLPFPAHIRAFVKHCLALFVSCEQEGRAYRAAHPEGDIFSMGCIVWGEEYIRNFLHYNVRSMLSDGNLPGLARQGRIVFSIVTDPAGEARLLGDALFQRLLEFAEVRFWIIPDVLIDILRQGHVVRHFYILYGMLDHCSIFFAQGAKSHLFMIPVDCVVAAGTLVNMANYRHEGFECCGGGNLVAESETFLPALDGLFPGDAPITISTHDLASLAFQHAHHYFQSQIIASENKDFGKHPRELFWPVEGGVEIHSVFIHPLFTSAEGLARYRRKHYANIDYGMIPRVFSAPGPIKLMDPSRAYVNNFTAGGRKYETTGRNFSYEDFVRCHDWTYPVQKGLFVQPQHLPCRIAGYTACNDLAADVRAINVLFGVEDKIPGRAPEEPTATAIRP